MRHWSGVFPNEEGWCKGGRANGVNIGWKEKESVSQFNISTRLNCRNYENDVHARIYICTQMFPECPLSACQIGSAGIESNWSSGYPMRGFAGLGWRHEDYESMHEEDLYHIFCINLHLTAPDSMDTAWSAPSLCPALMHAVNHVMLFQVDISQCLRKIISGGPITVQSVMGCLLVGTAMTWQFVVPFPDCSCCFHWWCWLYSWWHMTRDTFLPFPLPFPWPSPLCV